MRKLWWEQPVCILCDFWYLFLIGIIIILALLFTNEYWLPFLGFNTPSQTPSIILTQSSDTTENTHVISTPVPYPISTQTIQDDQKKFIGSGYTLLYPSDWVAIQPENSSDDHFIYDLVLSDAPGNNNPQSATDDETGRLTVALTQNPDGFDLDEWIFANYAWLGVEILPKELGGQDCRYAPIVDSDSGQTYQYYWVEGVDQIYIITIHYS